MTWHCLPWSFRFRFHVLYLCNINLRARRVWMVWKPPRFSRRVSQSLRGPPVNGTCITISGYSGNILKPEHQTPLRLPFPVPPVNQYLDYCYFQQDAATPFCRPIWQHSTLKHVSLLSWPAARYAWGLRWKDLCLPGASLRLVWRQGRRSMMARN